MFIRSLIIFIGCVQQIASRHLRAYKCVDVENFALEPAVVVVRARRQSQPDGLGINLTIFARQEETIRVRVPPAHDGKSSWNFQCFYDLIAERNDYLVDRLSFDNGVMTQKVSPQSHENGLHCVVEVTNDLWCQVDYAKTR